MSLTANRTLYFIFSLRKLYRRLVGVIVKFDKNICVISRFYSAQPFPIHILTRSLAPALSRLMYHSPYFRWFAFIDIASIDTTRTMMAQPILHIVFDAVVCACVYVFPCPATHFMCACVTWVCIIIRIVDCRSNPNIVIAKNPMFVSAHKTFTTIWWIYSMMTSAPAWLCV